MDITERAKKMVVVMDKVQAIYDNLEVLADQLALLDPAMKLDIEETEKSAMEEIEYLASIAGSCVRNMVREIAAKESQAVAEAEKILMKGNEEPGSP